MPGGGYGAVPALFAGAADAGQTGRNVRDPAPSAALRAAAAAAVGLHHAQLPHRLHHVLRQESHGEQSGSAGQRSFAPHHGIITTAIRFFVFSP